MKLQRSAWIVTCEHGGNQVPLSYRPWFASKHAGRLLGSHRGFDPGAWEASLAFAHWLFGESVDSPFQQEGPGGQPASHLGRHSTFETGFEKRWIASRTTRLLVDLNRSPVNAQVFSELTGQRSDVEKCQLLTEWHAPYREFIDQQVSSLLDSHDLVTHLSIHTFTPRLRREWRAFDIGLLFDPHRAQEPAFCYAWQARLSHSVPRLRVRLNEPYHGTDDGLTSTLRQKYPSSHYLGIEVEINQRFFKRSQDAQAKVVSSLLDSLPRNP